MKWNVPILINWCLTQLSSRKLHQAECSKPWRRGGERITGARGVWDTSKSAHRIQNQLSRTQALTENEAAIQDPVWVSARSSARSLWLFSLVFFRTPNSQNASFACSRNPFPPTGLPPFSLSMRLCLVSHLIMSCSLDNPESPGPFCKEQKRKAAGKRAGGEELGVVERKMLKLGCITGE